MAGNLRIPDAFLGGGETTLTVRDCTESEQSAARRAVLLRMERGVLTAEETADLLAMLGLADDLLLPGAPLWVENPAHARPGARKRGLCRAGLHERTPENTGHRGRCTPCRRKAAGKAQPGRNAAGQFLPSPRAEQ